MKKRSLALLAISVLLLTTCCACRGTDDSGVDNTAETETLKTEAYSLELPKDVTVEKKADGTVSLFRDGAEIGGIVILDFPGAETLPEYLTVKEYQDQFDQLADMVAPEGSAIMFDYTDILTLSVSPDAPEPAEDQPETWHYFFPQGDRFYDVFVQRGTLSPEEEKTLTESFTLTPAAGEVKTHAVDSALYSEEEINAAMETIQREFNENWKGCTLTELYYAGDNASTAYQTDNDADEVIVLESSFDVDASGGDGSLNPNSTYDNWMWVLVRTDGGEWVHVDHGY